MLYGTKRSICLSNGTTSTSRNTHLNQAHADKRNDNTRNQRSNNPAGILQYTTDKHFYRRPHDTCTKNSGKSSRQSGRNNRADKRETGSLNTEQSATDRSYPTTLDKSRDTRCKQSHRNQKAGCFQIEFQRAGNDQRRSNDGHKNSQ